MLYPIILGDSVYLMPSVMQFSTPDVQFGWIFHVPLDSTKVIPSLNHGFWRVFIQYSREEISLSNFIAPQKFSIDHGSMGQSSIIIQVLGSTSFRHGSGPKLTFDHKTKDA